MSEAKGSSKNTVSGPAGRKLSGITAPDRKPTMQFLTVFTPQRFLVMNATKPKQMLKKKFIRYASVALSRNSTKASGLNCTLP